MFTHVLSAWIQWILLASRQKLSTCVEPDQICLSVAPPSQDVFTISVGNLPPSATVLIKVTLVSELIVRDGSILFTLPGSLAPWQQSAALNQTTQVREQQQLSISLT